MDSIPVIFMIIFAGGAQVVERSSGEVGGVEELNHQFESLSSLRGRRGVCTRRPGGFRCSIAKMTATETFYTESN